MKRRENALYPFENAALFLRAYSSELSSVDAPAALGKGSRPLSMSPAKRDRNPFSKRHAACMALSALISPARRTQLSVRATALGTASVKAL